MAKATVVVYNDAMNNKTGKVERDTLCVVKFRGRNITEVRKKVQDLKDQLAGAWSTKVHEYF